MNLFSTKENQTKIVAVFDVGNGAVSGALVEITRGAKPVILIVEKSDIEPTSESFGELFGATTKAIESVGHKLLHAKRGAPTQTFCFLATPWYAGATRVIKMAKSAPFVFTKKICQDLIDKEIKRFSEEAVLGNSDAVLIENKNMSIRLNGYESMDPIGKEAREAEISVFFSVSSKNILESFSHAIHRSFSTVPVTFGSFIFSNFITIRDVFSGSASNAILVDLGSRVTEVALVQNDTLTSLASFPGGVAQIHDAIRATFGISVHEADSLLHLYGTDRLEPSKSKKVASIISREVGKWYTSFDQALGSLDSNPIPTTMFITVDERSAKLFRFTQELTEKRSVANVTVIDGSTFFAHVRPDRAAYRDPFIMLESLFITRLID